MYYKSKITKGSTFACNAFRPPPPHPQCCQTVRFFGQRPILRFLSENRSEKESVRKVTEIENKMHFWRFQCFQTCSNSAPGPPSTQNEFPGTWDSSDSSAMSTGWCHPTDRISGDKQDKTAHCGLLFSTFCTSKPTRGLLVQGGPRGLPKFCRRKKCKVHGLRRKYRYM